MRPQPPLSQGSLCHPRGHTLSWPALVLGDRPSPCQQWKVCQACVGKGHEPGCGLSSPNLLCPSSQSQVELRGTRGRTVPRPVSQCHAGPLAPARASLYSPSSPQPRALWSGSAFAMFPLPGAVSSHRFPYGAPSHPSKPDLDPMVSQVLSVLPSSAFVIFLPGDSLSPSP